MSKMMDQMVEFYDPHPGFGGAVVPLPVGIREVVHSLAGKRLLLSQAVQELVRVCGQGKLKVVEDDLIITLTLAEKGENASIHCWRLLQFRFLHS